MKLPHHNWEKAVTEELDYPEEVFQPLVRMLLHTKRWMDDTWLIEDEVAKTKKRMVEYRYKKFYEDQQRRAEEEKARVAFEEEFNDALMFADAMLDTSEIR